MPILAAEFTGKHHEMASKSPAFDHNLEGFALKGSRFSIEGIEGQEPI